MPTSQNGYPANDASLVSSRLIPGTTRKVTVRKGAAGDLLLWVAGQFDKRVEDIEAGQLDDWGYAERTVRGGTDLSNHASGTAVDLNAPKHPLGTDPTANFTRAQIDEIHRILAQTQGCVRWGGDYTGRKDPMHFEIVRDEATCARVLAALTSGTPDQEEDDMFTDDDRNRAIATEQLLRSIEKELTGDPEGDPTVARDMKTLLPGNVPGWDTAIGKRTAIGMLVALVNGLLGNQPSRIAGDQNKTNVVDLAFDSAKWTFEDKQTLAAMRDKLDQILTKLDGSAA